MDLQNDIGLSWQQRFAKKYTAPAISLGLLGFSAVGFVLSQRDNTKAASDEHHAYGNLYEYKDKIPQAMVSKDLPPFDLWDDKFVIKYYIATEKQTGFSFDFLPIPPEAHQVIKNGLDRWKDYVVFSEVFSPEEADIKIYGDDKILKPKGNAAIGFFDSSLFSDSTHHKTLDLMGAGILINLQEWTKQSSLMFHNEDVIVHEFGHLMGLQHPEVVLAFDVRKEGGYSSVSEAPTVLHRLAAEKTGELYPKFRSLSVMLAKPTAEVTQPELGEFDKAAMKIVIQRAQEAKRDGLGENNWLNRASPPNNNIQK